MSDLRMTERRNPRTVDIDLASPREIVELLNREDSSIAAAVATQTDAIAEAVVLVEAAFRAGGRLLYVGAGTSGRLGVLDASECPPTFGVSPEMVQGIIAGGLPALTKSQEGAEDDEAAAVHAIDERDVNSRDVVMGIAASGTTPFVGAALHRARTRGAHTVLLSCAQPPAETLAVADVAILPIVGPEVITGSTRLKAGTATKLVLNTITTGAMVRLGKTYGNLMVDLRATNAKLTDRAERIVMEVCQVGREEARATLSAADGHVKTAIVMQLLHVGRHDAEQRLESVGGVIRRIVAEAPPVGHD